MPFRPHPGTRHLRFLQNPKGMNHSSEERLVGGRVAPQRIAAVLLGVVLVLAAAHVVTKILWGFVFPRYHLNYYHYIYGAYHFFDMARGSNLPAYFSTLIKLSAGLLAATIAASERKAGERDWRYWAFLAGGFLWLSLDEGAKVHDTLVTHLFNVLFPGTRLGAYGWFVVYIPLLIGAGVAFVPFLKRLSREHRAWIVAGGVIFFGGGLGVEMIESALNGRGPNKMWIDIAVLIEETLEMVGIVVFNYAFLTYCADHGIGVQLRPASPSG